MSDWLQRAELQKLSDLLDKPVAELLFLSHLDLPDMRALREGISAHLFDRNAKMVKGLADSTRLLPNALVATISEKLIPPLISAQVTGLLKVDVAVDVAERLPPVYLADVSVALDPRRAQAVLRAMPVPQLSKVAHELTLRRRFMAMARFVDVLRDEQIQAVAHDLNGEALLKIGFYVESDERLDQLLALLSEDQLRDAVLAAANDDGALWPEVLALSERLGDEQRSRLGDLLADSSPEVLQSFSNTLFLRDLWRDAAQMLNAMNDGAQEVVMSAVASHADRVSSAVDPLKNLLPLLSESLRRKLRLLRSE